MYSAFGSQNAPRLLTWSCDYSPRLSTGEHTLGAQSRKYSPIAKQHENARERTREHGTTWRQRVGICLGTVEWDRRMYVRYNDISRQTPTRRRHYSRGANRLERALRYHGAYLLSSKIVLVPVLFRSQNRIDSIQRLPKGADILESYR